MQRKQKLIYKKLIERGVTQKAAESFSAIMIDEGYCAKQLDRWDMPPIEVLRKRSADRNCNDAGGSTEEAEDFKIAERQARFAMNGRPAGMTYNDVLEFGFDVITFERHGDGSKLHGMDLENGIRRRIVREKKQWRKRNNKIAPVEAIEQSCVDLPVSLSPRPDYAKPEDSRLGLLQRLCNDLSRKEIAILRFLESGITQADAALLSRVSQSTVSNLISTLRARARRLGWNGRRITRDLQSAG